MITVILPLVTRDIQALFDAIRPRQVVLVFWFGPSLLTGLRASSIHYAMIHQAPNLIILTKKICFITMRVIPWTSLVIQVEPARLMWILITYINFYNSGFLCKKLPATMELSQPTHTRKPGLNYAIEYLSVIIWATKLEVELRWKWSICWNDTTDQLELFRVSFANPRVSHHLLNYIIAIYFKNSPYQCWPITLSYLIIVWIPLYILWICITKKSIQGCKRKNTCFDA